MKKIIFTVACMLTTSLQATNYGTANKVCSFSGKAMVIELTGGVNRYIIGDYAMHKPPTDRKYSKGKLILENAKKINIVKKWQFENSVYSGNSIGVIHTPLTFDLTGKYGSYAPFNVYELCE